MQQWGGVEAGGAGGDAAGSEEEDGSGLQTAAAEQRGRVQAGRAQMGPV